MIRRERPAGTVEDTGTVIGQSGLLRREARALRFRTRELTQELTAKVATMRELSMKVAITLTDADLQRRLDN